ncbi:hypothetical protein [Rhizobium bangladeshense]|uniref:hypothetical protein n=1 Tax=Rhizobium bangladeshense TaxID=1138189 RepID=UPI001C8360D9|nr:hypothetical protein [Rhizobium bangladeshense]MBY3615809.1 hypothetical protein [Rhizobium bangladeshense]
MGLAFIFHAAVFGEGGCDSIGAAIPVSIKIGLYGLGEFDSHSGLPILFSALASYEPRPFEADKPNLRLDD